MSAKRYLIWFFTTLSALAAISASLNYVVDPYLVYNSPRVEGFNRKKIEINDYVRIAKAFEPFRRATDILIAGNSRVEMGLDPGHACFAGRGLHVYNLAVPGAGLGQQLNYVLNVVYAQPVKRVFLSVDFVDFLVATGSAPPTQDNNVTTGILPRRFDGSDNDQYLWEISKTRFQALFSLNALVDSLRTVLLQRNRRTDRLPNGFNPAREFAHATSIEGPGALFEQKMASLRERFGSPTSIRYLDGTLAREFELFSRFLDIAAVNNLEVTILTNPFHEWFWDLLQKHGLIATHADWFAEIESRVREAPGRVTMWDFSMDSNFIHEPVPPPGEKAPPLHWFWEPSHYRKTLGDKMLESMLATECGLQVSLFGRQVVGPD